MSIEVLLPPKLSKSGAHSCDVIADFHCETNNSDAGVIDQARHATQRTIRAGFAPPSCGRTPNPESRKAHNPQRSEERSDGKKWVGTEQTRWWQDNNKKNNQ